MNEKDTYVQQMFSSIASRYDLLNRLLSCGIDVSWRRKAIQELSIGEGAFFLDIATGTCDVALDIVKKNISGVTVAGLDFSFPMLTIGKKKVKREGEGERISLHYADAQRLPFRDNSFDGTIIAFGLRNIGDKKTGIAEMIRVVKKGGRVVILEFTTPEQSLFKKIYYFYFKKVLPVIGGLISGKKEAYQYLPDSVMEFPDRNRLKILLEEAGLQDVRYSILTFGIAAVHVGIK